MTAMHGRETREQYEAEQREETRAMFAETLAFLDELEGKAS